MRDEYTSHALERVFESMSKQKAQLFYASCFVLAIYTGGLLVAPLPFKSAFWAGGLLLGVLFLWVAIDLINIHWKRAEPVLPLHLHGLLFVAAVFGMVAMMICLVVGLQ